MSNPFIDKPYSEACERNAPFIAEVLSQWLRGDERVLEIGSGTGQHAATFCQQFSDMTWQPSDVAEHLSGIEQWVSGFGNCAPPVPLDVLHEWPRFEAPFDAAYTANTLHIMSWPAVEACFSGLGRCLNRGGRWVVYGPFYFSDEAFAESNQRFDAFLRQRDPASGIRAFDDLLALAKETGWRYIERRALPANNHMLLFEQSEAP